MFRIGEFSKLTQVSVRMLRYYDEAGLLKPAQTDPFTGYRMYSVDQIPVLNQIVYLRDSGFQVAEIALAVRCRNQEQLLELLNRKQSQIEQNILNEQEKLKKIEISRKELAREENPLHYQITLKDIPAMEVLSLRRRIPDYYAEAGLWQELSSFIAGRKVSISASAGCFSIYHDLDYREQDVDVELCVPVEHSGPDRDGFTFRTTEAVPTMACTMVYGPFSNISGAYRSFACWLQANNHYQMSGPNRQIVHRGP